MIWYDSIYIICTCWAWIHRISLSARYYLIFDTSSENIVKFAVNEIRESTPPPTASSLPSSIGIRLHSSSTACIIGNFRMWTGRVFDRFEAKINIWYVLIIVKNVWDRAYNSRLQCVRKKQIIIKKTILSRYYISYAKGTDIRYAKGTDRSVHKYLKSAAPNLQLTVLKFQRIWIINLIVLASQSWTKKKS